MSEKDGRGQVWRKKEGIGANGCVTSMPPCPNPRVLSDIASPVFADETVRTCEVKMPLLSSCVARQSARIAVTRQPKKITEYCRKKPRKLYREGSGNHSQDLPPDTDPPNIPAGNKI